MVSWPSTATTKSSLGGSVIAYQSALMSFRSQFRKLSDWRQPLGFSNTKHLSVSCRLTETATERSVRRHWVTWTLIPGAKVRLLDVTGRAQDRFLSVFVCFCQFYFFVFGGARACVRAYVRACVCVCESVCVCE